MFFVYPPAFVCCLFFLLYFMYLSNCHSLSINCIHNYRLYVHNVTLIFPRDVNATKGYLTQKWNMRNKRSTVHQLLRSFNALASVKHLACCFYFLLVYWFSSNLNYVSLLWYESRSLVTTNSFYMNTCIVFCYRPSVFVSVVRMRVCLAEKETIFHYVFFVWINSWVELLTKKVASMTFSVEMAVWESGEPVSVLVVYFQRRAMDFNVKRLAADAGTFFTRAVQVSLTDMKPLGEALAHLLIS